MPGLYGNVIANEVSEIARASSTAHWTALQVGSAPLGGRQWVEIQVKGPTALALSYANVLSNGTFTTPTDGTRDHQVIPANSIKVFPISDKVTIFGRAIGKAGNADGGSKIIVTEYK